ncbi:MAG: hypothetical protein KME03_18955 [Aphanocapsa lilacina HA4352-LM1]|nr:hypothetical protein [Aphanocapsa lilacina HA4352-LM1]
MPNTAVTSAEPPRTVHAAAELFPLPALAYLRASQGERIALVCRGLGGLLQRVEALGGRLVWFFAEDERPVGTLLADEAAPFDLVVEYRSRRQAASSTNAIMNGQSD